MPIPIFFLSIWLSFMIVFYGWLNWQSNRFYGVMLLDLLNASFIVSVDLARVEIRFN